MNDKTECEPCDLVTAGDTDAVLRADSIRANRVILSILNGYPDAAGTVLTAELNGCPFCTHRIATLALGMSAQALAHMAGNTEDASKWVEQLLMEDLDEHHAANDDDGCDPPPVNAT
ncbi:hypothetical protein [Mycobacterium syngnathidarum]